MIAAMELEKQYRSDVEMLRQDGETKRKLMDVTLAGVQHRHHQRARSTSRS
jgi:hypothetical protein